jgi:hypothetical protein
VYCVGCFPGSAFSLNRRLRLTAGSAAALPPHWLAASWTVRVRSPTATSPLCKVTGREVQMARASFSSPPLSASASPRSAAWTPLRA